MTSSHPYFELQLSAAGITPQSLSAGELADIIKATASIVREVANDADSVHVSVVGIEEGSVLLKFASPGTVTFITGLAFLGSAISAGEPVTNENLRHSLEVFQSFAERHEGVVNIRHASELVFSVDGATLPVPKVETLKGPTSIFGRVLRVGGKEPAVRIELGRGELTCYASEALVQSLGASLYDWVVLTGEATWENETYGLLSFRIHSFAPMLNSTASQSFAKLAEVAAVHFQGVDADEFIRQARGEAS